MLGQLNQGKGGAAPEIWRLPWLVQNARFHKPKTCLICGFLVLFYFKTRTGPEQCQWRDCIWDRNVALDCSRADCPKSDAEAVSVL
jgi:hypothetical protein